MKNIKSALTRIKSKCEEHLPTENDLFGFQGINKELIITSIIESYNLANAIEDYEGKFETIILKRKITDYLQKINKIIDLDFKEKENKSSFNDFLNIISKIKYNINETFIVLSKDPIRSDIEIAKTKEELDELRKYFEEINNINDEIKIIKETYDGTVKKLSDTVNGATEIYSIIKGDFSDIQEKVEKIKENNTIVATILENTEANRKTIESNKKDLSENLSRSETNLNIIEEQKTENEKNNTELESILNRSIKQQDKIDEILKGASRTGMSGSFKERKDELKDQVKFWRLAAIISISSLIILSIILIVNPNKVIPADLKDPIIKIPFFFSMIWLSWFCAKQYGFSARLFEDYSYKYAISLAFEGFKSEVEKLDDEKLIKELIDLTIMNISVNPTTLYNTRLNHATPYHEIFEKVVSFLKLKKQVE